MVREGIASAIEYAAAPAAIITGILLHSGAERIAMVPGFFVVLAAIAADKVRSSN